MSKKDFVTAWLLAARMTSASFTGGMLQAHIKQAEQIWEELEQRYED